MTKEKKEKELNPKLEEKSNYEITSQEMKNIVKSLEENTDVKTFGENTDDSFYKNVLNKLFDEKEMSTKTEYLSVRENFLGAKLEFYAKFGNIPQLKNFIDVFEKKRVSLNRKGRIEILKSLQERQQDTQENKLNNLKNLFGI